jgi:hypothetical protein
MSLRIKWSLAPTVAASLGMATSAMAQTAPAPAAGAPPSRVGWLSQLTGSVSFHGADAVGRCHAKLSRGDR